MQLRVRRDDALALTRERSALLEQSARGLETAGNRVHRRCGIWRAGDGAHEEFLQRPRAREQNLAFVGEVPEERSLCESRPFGDLRHRGLFESALAVELQCRLLEPAARVWLPSTHGPMVSDDSG